MISKELFNIHVAAYDRAPLYTGIGKLYSLARRNAYTALTIALETGSILKETRDRRMAMLWINFLSGCIY